MSKRDLITKDFALYVVHYFASMQTWNKEDVLAEIDRKIKEAEPEDAVCVVRCKDCKNWEDGYFGYCVKSHSAMDYDGFCSYGERRSE